MPSKKQSRRLRQNLKQFSQKRVDVSKYIKDFYVENGLAYISCNVSGYYDIIDRYSVDGYEWLSEPFTRFVETNAIYVPTEYPIVLEICGHHFSRREKQKIEEAVADYYALKMGDTQLALEANTSKSLILLIFGIIFTIILFMIGNSLSDTMYEAIALFFWFFLWEFFDCAWFERRDLREAKTDAAQMASIKVIFKEVFTDDPVPDEEEILDEIFEEEVLEP